MKSAAQTRYDKMVASKLSILIALWVLDKIIMIAMLILVLMSSCGSTYYHVGTGEPMKKHCSGAWVR